MWEGSSIHRHLIYLIIIVIPLILTLSLNSYTTKNMKQALRIRDPNKAAKDNNTDLGISTFVLF